MPSVAAESSDNEAEDAPLNLRLDPARFKLLVEFVKVNPPLRPSESRRTPLLARAMVGRGGVVCSELGFECIDADSSDKQLLELNFSDGALSRVNEDRAMFDRYDKGSTLKIWRKESV